MARGSEDVIAAEAAGTLDGLFRERVHRSGQRLAYRSFDRAAQRWRDLTWQDMADQAGRWQQALVREDLRHGDRVAVLLRNGPEWVMFEQAALGLGLVVVPLYVDDRPDNVAYILRDAAVKVFLLGDWGGWRRLEPALEGVDCLRRVLILDPDGKGGGPAVDDPRVVPVRGWLPDGVAALQGRDGDPGELATIVYTSGTTGRPKGVMLSHLNILSIAHSAIASYDVYVEDVFLSFLPLSHTFERTAGYYVPMMAGAVVAYARSVQQLAEDLQVIRPTVLIAVPRIFERVYARVQEQLARKSVFARALFRAAVRLGWRRFEAGQGRARCGPLGPVWPVLDRLVAGKVRDRLGGRMRVAVSGGAALPVQVARTFIGLGLTIVQGYGMTETSPVVSGNPLDDNDPASVGVPLRNVEVRIGEQDELLVRGPGVMLGYWNNHAATAAIIDDQGWLHTGDQARLGRGHIYITGRIKDIVVLSNGEKAPPADIEAAIALDPLFEQVMVLGEGRPFLAVLLVLSPEHWFGLARELGVDPFRPESLADDRLHRKLVARIRQLMHDFPGHTKIRRIHVTLEPWTIENGLLTPTFKVRRNQVLERYAREIEAMYGG